MGERSDNRPEPQPVSQAALRFAHRTAELRIDWWVRKAREDRRATEQRRAA